MGAHTQYSHVMFSRTTHQKAEEVKESKSQQKFYIKTCQIIPGERENRLLGT